MGQNAWMLWHRVFDLLGEESRGDNPLYTAQAVARAATFAQEAVSGLMMRSEMGLFETVATLVLPAGGLSVALPSDCRSVLRVRADGVEVDWMESRAARRAVNRGVHLVGNALVVDQAATAEETWEVEYVSRPYPARAGRLLSVQPSNVREMWVDAVDSGGLVGGFTGWSGMDVVVIGEGDPEASAGATVSYGEAGSGSGASGWLLATATATGRAGAEEYLAVDGRWPVEWLDVLAIGTAMNLPEAPRELLGGLYGTAAQAAMELAARRVAPMGRRVVFVR